MSALSITLATLLGFRFASNRMACENFCAVFLDYSLRKVSP